MTRMAFSRRLCLGICGLLLCAVSVSRGGATREDMDRIMKPLADDGWLRGVAVATITTDGTNVYGYGRVSDENPVAPAGDTIFEIGSVSKTFTGLLLAQMIEAKEVALNDPVEKYLPADVHMKQHGGPITLKHLTTHRSGLARMPGNFAPKDKDNPYADYTPQQMYAFLHGTAPSHAPDAQYEYSNLGEGLLGHVLSLRAGTSYEQLLIDRITKPLGLKDTCVRLSDDQRKRLAPPHDPEGRPARNWDFADVIAGAGGIRSTPNDMARYVAANLGLVDTPLNSAMTMTQQRLAKVDGGMDIGMNWHIATRRHIVWHNGQTGAYHAYVGFIPEKKIGVVLLDNYSQAIIDQLGPMLLGVLAGEKVEPLTLPHEVALDPARLDEFVGDYALTPVFFIRVARTGDHLTAQASLQPPLRIYPQGDATFFYKSVRATLTFERDAAGRVSSLTLEQNSAKRKGPRIK